MLIRRYKKMDVGGVSTTPYGQLGSFLGDSLDSLTPTNQYGVKSNFDAGLGSALKGAGTGAQIGSLFGPVGTGIGAGLGAIAGGISGIDGNNTMRREQDRAINMQEAASRRKDANRLLSYDVTGSNNNNIYRALGGYTPLANKWSIGGDLTKLGDNRYEVDGRSHAEGGVKFPQDNVELEDGETVSGDYVFSDKLGFADRHKPIARMIGKIEKKPQTKITRNTLTLLKGKEDNLKQEQEQVRALIGGTPLDSFEYGGEPPKKNYGTREVKTGTNIAPKTWTGNMRDAWNGTSSTNLAPSSGSRLINNKTLLKR